jgi:hypothetical protein
MTHWCAIRLFYIAILPLARVMNGGLIFGPDEHDLRPAQLDLAQRAEANWD